MLGILLVVVIVGQAPLTAFALAIHRDGSPLKRSFWSA